MIHRGLKIALTLASALSVAPTQPQTYTGFAVYYEKNVMERVAANRGMEPASCMTASFREPLGRWVAVTGQRTGVTRRCKVVDVCAPKDCPALRRRKIVTELDYWSNGAICGKWREPARSCPVIVEEMTP